MIKVEKSFERFHTHEHSHYSGLHKRLNLMMEHTCGPYVIDIGCGTGLTLYLLSQRNDITKIVGVDIQQEALDEAKINADSYKVSFYRCESECLPFNNNIFDTVILTETLEHVKDVDKTLSEARRVLRNNGDVVITVPNEGRVSKRQGSWSHVRAFTKESLMEDVNKYFKCIKTGVLEKYLYYVGNLEGVI